MDEVDAAVPSPVVPPSCWLACAASLRETAGICLDWLREAHPVQVASERLAVAMANQGSKGVDLKRRGMFAAPEEMG